MSNWGDELLAGALPIAKPTCSNCRRLEERLAAVTQRADVLGTENAALKEKSLLAEAKYRAADAMLDLRATMTKDLETQLAAAKSETESIRSEAREYMLLRDQQKAGLQQQLNAAHHAMEERAQALAKELAETAIVKSEIWKRVADALGLQLRVGYEITEQEIMIAIDLERERASVTQRSLEELGMKYRGLTQRLVGLEQGNCGGPVKELE